MSWDVSFYASKAPPPPVAEMPDDWRGEPRGTPASVRAKISEYFPEVDWTKPEWGTSERDGFSFEFNLGSENPCESFMVHVRGSGDSVTHLLALAERNDWYLLDCSSGEWMHHCENPDEGWKNFQAYRDRVLERLGNS
jgi:hypothetical protein